MRLAAARRPPAVARCERGDEIARRRRGHHRQDGDHRIRLLSSRTDPQSARSCNARRGGRRRVRPPPSRPAWSRLRLAPRPTARPSGRRPSAASTAPSPATATISRAGALMLSQALDHVGVFARTLADVALLLDVLTGYDMDDADTRPAAAPAFLETLIERAAIAATLGLRAHAGLGQARAWRPLGLRGAGRGTGRCRGTGRTA